MRRVNACIFGFEVRIGPDPPSCISTPATHFYIFWFVRMREEIPDFASSAARRSLRLEWRLQLEVKCKSDSAVYSDRSSKLPLSLCGNANTLPLFISLAQRTSSVFVNPAASV